MITKIIFFLLTLWVLLFCLQQTSKIEPIQVFDPFEILEIEKSATDKEIKKAFRRLSLRWHPDKNRDNPLPAAAKFRHVTKAYEALTDELARSNWEKYGNPDGQGPMQVAIGLPKFLLESENAISVLVVCFVVMVVVIPIFFFQCYSATMGSNDVQQLKESAMIYGQLLNEQMVFMNVSRILSLSKNFEHLRIQGKHDAE
jgi:translocation protein SEC63